MKKRNYWILATAILLTVALTASAASDSVLGPIYDAGKTLLFDTDNVTLSGYAYFSLDGELFKTVKAKYIQDNVNSVWDYKLYTPLADETGEKESGYTVYANGEEVCVADACYPGTYRNGYCESQNTLVRRSALLDQVVGLIGAAVSCTEPLLPEGAVEVITENHTGKTVRVTLEESNISDLAKTAFNLATQMVISRAIERENFDYLPSPYIPFRAFSTVSKAIVSCTERYDLNFLDVTAILDGNGRLRSLNAGLTVILDLAEECLSEGEPEQRRLDITLSVSVSDYGTSKVNAFDPEAAGLRLQWYDD